MIAGILDAMWSDYPLAARVIWQCLENHANGDRFWRMTHQEIAAELHLSLDTVNGSVAFLERERIIRCVRQKRRPTTFYMVRSYATGATKPRHEAEIERRITPDLMTEIPSSSAELMTEFPLTKSPPVRIHQEGRESAPASPTPTPQAAPPSPSPPPVVVVGVEGKQASCQEQGGADRPEPPTAPRSARKTAWPEDQPPPGVRELVIAAGYGGEVVQAMGDWCRDRAHRSADWPAWARRWIAREGTFRPTAAARSGGGGRWDRPWLVEDLRAMGAPL
jgi:hypothetical protein